MTKSWILVLGFVAAMGCSFLAGEWFVGRRAVKNLVEFGQTVTVADLNFRIEELVWLRSGETERALAFMEGRLDAAVTALHRGHSWSEIPEPVRDSLSVARHYREAFPFERATTEAKAAFAAMPDEPLDPASRRPAVRYLLAHPAGR